MDHVEGYRQPKEDGNEDDITRQLRDEGCAPQVHSNGGENSEEDNETPKTKKKKKGKLHKCREIICIL